MSGALARPPAGYISPSGDVLVPPELARILYTHGHLDEFHQAKGHVRPDLGNLLEALRMAGTRWAGADHGSIPAVVAEVRAEWFTTKQVGLRTGVSPRRVLQLIESGRLQAEKFGGRWRIRAEDLRHLLAARNQER
ncbi:helix-turn-helix domain-containing protein [Microbacterium sp. 22303]|uniref:helix-turn-helix domain-containing protein n=1 Tax=Microbacterium sp. 22303 TaxID=3453905 RepID=UPI003F83CB7E